MDTNCTTPEKLGSSKSWPIGELEWLLGSLGSTQSQTGETPGKLDSSKSQAPPIANHLKSHFFHKFGFTEPSSRELFPLHILLKGGSARYEQIWWEYGITSEILWRFLKLFD